MTALLKKQCQDLCCSDCKEPIAANAGHYVIEFHDCRIHGGKREVEQTESIATVCAKCSLSYDLTRLNPPNKEGYYSHEPLGFALTDKHHCSLCQNALPKDGKFQEASIRPVGISKSDEATITISLCPTCSEKRLLRYAEPPSNACPPCCYQCGTYTGYTGGYSDQRKFYVAHPSVKPYALPGGRVRVCEECFIEELEATN